TKQDVEAITRKIESIKAEISREQPISDAKYKLKHQACIEALTLIDALFSHKMQHVEGRPIATQYMSTEQARQCHSKLILACENPDILKKFSEIISEIQQETLSKRPTDYLNEFRNLIRTELGLGEELVLDGKRAWIGNVVCDNQEFAGERQVKLAEDVLGLFYEARDAIDVIRSGLDSDGFTSLVDAVDKRLKQRAETFNKLKSMRSRFVVQFGPDEAGPFEEIRQVLIEIRNAVDHLREFGDAHMGAYDDAEDDEQLIMAMKEYEAILTCSREDEDEIDERVKRAVSQMEETCRNVIMER
ncbi:MAG: hypothetical protein PVJ86_08385, partial [Phycisphaerales bacterium]